MTKPDMFTPTVDDADVERVVRRDYPNEIAVVMTLIAPIDVREQARVILACLKVASGNLAALRGELANASGWYREIISAAEYPLSSKRWNRMDSMTEEEILKIYDADWKQYSSWLYRP